MADAVVNTVDEDEVERAVDAMIFAGGVNWVAFDRDSLRTLARAALASRSTPIAVVPEELRAAVEEVPSFRIGELPSQGWLRDNDRSRRAIAKLATLLADHPLMTEGGATADAATCSRRSAMEPVPVSTKGFDQAQEGGR